MIPGETLASGAPHRCPRCGIEVVKAVYRSRAGWYVGTWCTCGPYTRESGYYQTEAEAQAALQDGGYGR